MANGNGRESIYLQKRETMLTLDNFFQTKGGDRQTILPSLGFGKRREKRTRRDRSKTTPVQNKKEEGEDNTIFGRSLEELETMSSFPVPIIVLQCISYLGRRRELEGMFRISTRQTHLIELKNRFVVPDRGGGGGGSGGVGWVDLEEATSDPHAVCALLKLFLRSLPTLVIPFSVFLKLVELIKERGKELAKEGLSDNYGEKAQKEEQQKIGAGAPPLSDAASAVITTINTNIAQKMREVMRTDTQMWKTCHISTAAAIFSFLEKVSEKSEANLMTASNLGVPMGPCLMAVEEGKEAEYMDIMMGSFDVKIVEFLINHHHLVFAPLMDELDSIASSSAPASSSSSLSSSSSPLRVTSSSPAPSLKILPRQQAFDTSDPPSSSPNCPSISLRSSFSNSSKSTTPTQASHPPLSFSQPLPASSLPQEPPSQRPSSPPPSHPSAPFPPPRNPISPRNPSPRNPISPRNPPLQRNPPPLSPRPILQNPSTKPPSPPPLPPSPPLNPLSPSQALLSPLHNPLSPQRPPSPCPRSSSPRPHSPRPHSPSPRPSSPVRRTLSPSPQSLPPPSNPPPTTIVSPPRSTSPAPPPLPYLPPTPLPPYLPPPPALFQKKEVYKWKVKGCDPLLSEKKIIPIFNIEVTIPYKPRPVTIHRRPEDILSLFEGVRKDLVALTPTIPSLSSALSSLLAPPTALEKEGGVMTAMVKVEGEVEGFLVKVGEVAGEVVEAGAELESFEKFLKDINPHNGWKDNVGFEVFAIFCQPKKEEMASGGDSGAGGYLCAKSGGEVEVVKKGEGEGFVREELWTVHRQIFRFKSTQHIKTYHLLRSVSHSTFLFHPRLLPTLCLDKEISERSCVDMNTDFWKICCSSLHKSPRYIHLKEGKLMVGTEQCDTMFRLDKVFESVSEIELKEKGC